MYSWEELKNSIFAKLDLESEDNEVDQLNYLNRFTTYANEAMTMICSTVKPKRTFHSFSATSGEIITMPNDFISFGDDVNLIDEDVGYGTMISRETSDDDFEYIGYNQILCHSKGTYRISYNARWHVFSSADGKEPLNVPVDILECIPSYVASQCMKVDDEYKSSVLRNEFEMLMARIDDTNYKSNKTFKIGGDW
jgi:hypothetical protein